MISKLDLYTIYNPVYQLFITYAIKDKQNSEWNFDADFGIEDSTPLEVNLPIFYQNKFGKDNSPGITTLFIENIITSSKDLNSGTCIPLVSTKSGKVLVSSNFQSVNEETTRFMTSTNKKNSQTQYLNNNDLDLSVLIQKSRLQLAFKTFK